MSHADVIDAVRNHDCGLTPTAGCYDMPGKVCFVCGKPLTLAGMIAAAIRYRDRLEHVVALALAAEGLPEGSSVKTPVGDHHVVVNTLQPWHPPDSFILAAEALGFSAVTVAPYYGRTHFWAKDLR